MVLLVERGSEDPSRGERFVVKQARGRLRTKQPWFASLERNWREAEVLTVCSQLISRRPPYGWLLKADTPEVLFIDQENYLFAMSAAPPIHSVWKDDLLAHRADDAVAIACGQLLGTL